MGRTITQAAASATAVLALAACGPVDSADDAPGEAQEAFNERVLKLPYSAQFKPSSVLFTDAFDLKQGATLTVAINAGWDRPSTCTKMPYEVTPYRKNRLGRYEDGLKTHPLPPDSRTHREIWPNVDAGRYMIEVDPRNTNPRCLLEITITISSS